MVKTRSQATMADSGNGELLALLAEMKKSMEAGLYLEGSIWGVPCLMLVDTGAKETLLRTDIAQKLNQQFIYTAPNI
ncbi:hypothetical protein NPIL_529921, partial [Nephila pilipes]